MCVGLALEHCVLARVIVNDACAVAAYHGRHARQPIIRAKNGSWTLDHPETTHYVC